MPQSCEKGTAEVAALGAKVSELVGEYIEAMEAAKIRSACGIAMSVSKAGNLFFQARLIMSPRPVPWKCPELPLPSDTSFPRFL